MALNPMIKNPRWLIASFSGLHKVWYRLTGGKIGRGLRGAPFVLLTTTGRKSGTVRTWPLLAVRDGDAYLFAASNSGHDHHPAWYLNLEANPDVEVRDGGTTLQGRARITSGEERAEKYRRFVDLFRDVREVPAGDRSPDPRRGRRAGLSRPRQGRESIT